MKLWPIIALLLLSCKYTFSPYEVGTVKLEQNTINLAKIKASEASTAADYKVALVSDTHNYYTDIRDLVNSVNENGPYSFVIVTGDVTNFGLLEEYKKAKEYLDKLTVPYLVVPGNHDLLANGKAVFRHIFGDMDFSFTFKDAEFIAFNNNNWEAGGTIPNIDAVEAKLLASASPQKILLSHVSPEDRERFSNSAIHNWKQLAQGYGVNYFINGHDHNPEVYNYGAGKRITVGAPSKRTYFELIFSAGGVTHQKINF